MASGEHEIAWASAFDTDDPTMNNEGVRRFCDERGIRYTFGNNRTKVEAINATMRAAPPAWDICVVVSDDMACLLQGWDRQIASDMQQHFPDLDGALWYPDGRQLRLNTFSVMGRKAYDSLGCIYDPQFKSVFCDDYYQNQMIRRNALRFINVDLVRHEWAKDNNDELLRRNEDRNLYEQDRQTWMRQTMPA